MFPILVVIVAVAVLYWFVARRWMARWGTTPSDLTRIMAGDRLIGDPTYSGTMAIIINAQPEHIWPWLVQMGYRRGGLYSYDWLDRLFGFLDASSAERILPEFQRLTVGDVIPVGRGAGFPVRALEPLQTLVLAGESEGFQWVWEFGLYPISGRQTRLVSRNRAHFPRTIGSTLFMCVLEPAAFIMTRKMLLGLKRRAEATATQRRGVATHAA